MPGMLLLMLGAMQQAPHLLQSMAQLYGIAPRLALQLANEIAGQWNETYNTYRPHQSLGYKTPGEFLKSWYDSSKRREEVSTM